MQIWHLHEVQDRSSGVGPEGQRELRPSFACGMWTYGVWHVDVEGRVVTQNFLPETCSKSCDSVRCA